MNKKELVKGFKNIIEDILDNYDKYTNEEKAQVKELFDKAAEKAVERRRHLEKLQALYSVEE